MVAGAAKALKIMKVGLNVFIYFFHSKMT